MALTFNWASKVVEASASITDLPAFHAELRDAEDSPTGVIYPVTHTWKALDLGGGAFFYQADLINGWTLKFPTPGNYTISGNLNATIVPVAGVYVERKTSAAFITSGTGSGASGASAADVWAYPTRALTVGGVGGDAPTAEAVSAAVWQRAIESGMTAEQMLRIFMSVMSGNAANLNGPNPTFLSIDGSKARLVGTVDAGVRTITTRDGT